MVARNKNKVIRMKKLPIVPKVDKLNPDEIWIVDRIEESITGRILIKTHLVNKYRKMTSNYAGTNSEIRSEMLIKYSEYI